ncbi:MAG: NADH-quinone oxidoreductase subunit L [Planctomycetaceae bacterium]
MSEQLLQIAPTLKWLLFAAWILPLLGFSVEIFAGWWSSRKSKAAAYLAVACIAMGFCLSVVAISQWYCVVHGDTQAHVDPEDAQHPAKPVAATAVSIEHEHPGAAGHGHDHPVAAAGHGADGHGAVGHGVDEHGHDAHHLNNPYETAVSGTYYVLADFGSLKLSLDYYIDGLTLGMFCMVTLIATCIHLFAMGYMSDELTEDYEDHSVHLPGGKHFHRPGRFYRFFAFLSLFCFSMLGLVLAGNIFQVFVFWELVGVCSYLLIGFYTERHSASTAANKAFIMNRVGDFGFLIGLMVLWTYCGTFAFANSHNPAHPEGGQPGLFQMVRDAHGAIHVEGEGREAIVHLNQETVGVAGLAEAAIPSDDPAHVGDDAHGPSIPYWLLVVAGLGIFAGCVGKSAQFPLQTWLPDAMEGPTPVSALVHSATMVAAGVYLAARFFPVFTPEVLLVIAYIGCITLFIGATIAIVATDIKRVLAYSTISQLGYMMLAIGLGGWIAGLFHLITHAFFKSLMFLCSGSVIYGCHHEQEMPKMGGLWRKMPWTAFTMLIGVIAISGLAIPGITIPGFGAIAFSGYHSKDAIVATGLAYVSQNPQHFLLFIVPLITAGITAFYMFRLWFLTFAGEPRDQHVYDHAHESPTIMVAPLVVLSFFAMFCAFGYPTGEDGPLASLLLTAEPASVAAGMDGAGQIGLNLPSHEAIHAKHSAAGRVALLAAVFGLIISWLCYGRRAIDAAAIKRQLSGVHHFLVEKWQFDNLYEAMFVRPVHIVARWAVGFDKLVIDPFLHFLASLTVWVARWDRVFDEQVVDRLVNVVGNTTFATAMSLRNIQTGRLRQYVMFIAAGVVCLFVLLFVFFPRA